ncbi:tRNA lysidine(34) synthetase TilS [Aliibacillus thermotolerans]|uniref:tRNA(Ile)-lysidine synthase n=1 Tax=Aliibacillus thermotolerans TaxID=1834418 RepID=A0ABW0U6E9_9BACI|nr:tRNA lysidine(34) synthetase TilS [Aliibacillus thermotolerans]MDA3128842.1 tRNA lysidine(34) synthetase TilS [Aliibacillus thermotolerans]
MRNKTEDWIKERRLLKQGDRVVVALSGGPDSMALLHLFYQLRKKWELQLFAAHVNHGLREDARADEEFVITWCQKWDIPLFHTTIDVKSAVKIGGSVQEEARRLRYQYFHSLMKDHRLDVLATGHHADDQVETILMKLTSGRSLLGEVGMKDTRPFSTGRLIRPLLSVTKTEILQYLEENDLPYQIDRSNFSMDYTRNRFRKMILPFLKKENPKVHHHFQVFADWVEEERTYIEEEAKRRLEKIIVRQNDGFVTISLASFQTWPLPLQRRTIHLILNYLCLKELPMISVLHIDTLISLIQQDKPSFSLDWPGGVYVFRSYHVLHFTTNKDNDHDTKHLQSLLFFEEATFHHYHFSKQTETEPISQVRHGDVLIVREEDIVFPLTIRTVQPGDRIQVLGMKGHKKVHRIFIDEKIPRKKRQTWPVVTDARGEVIWIPFLKKSSYHCRYREKGKTYVVLKCIDMKRNENHDIE